MRLDIESGEVRRQALAATMDVASGSHAAWLRPCGCEIAKARNG